MKAKKISKYTREFYIKTLRDFAEKLGRRPTLNACLNANLKPAPETYKRKFGSWNKALIAAGIKPTYRSVKDVCQQGVGQKYDNDYLIQLLKDLGKKLGRKPMQRDLSVTKGHPCPDLYYKRFGSFSNSLRIAGFDGAPIKIDRLNAASPEFKRIEIYESDLPAVIYINGFGSKRRFVLGYGENEKLTIING